MGSTVLREANLLRNLFTVAGEEWRWIDHNPFRGVRLLEQSEARRQVWTWQFIKRVLRAVAPAMNSPPWLREDPLRRLSERR